MPRLPTDALPPYGVRMAAAVLGLYIVFHVEPLHALGRPTFLPATVQFNDAILRTNFPSWAVHFHDVALFDIDGLRMFGGGGFFRRGSFYVDANASRLASPVGAETSVLGSIGYVREGGLWMAVGLEHQSVSIGSSVATLTSVGFDAGARIAGGAVVWTRVERLRIAGVEHGGADIVMGIDIATVGFVSLSGIVRVDRRYGTTIGAAVRVRPVDAFGLSAGFDEAGDTVFCRVTVRAEGVA
ncbi:MAG: hypothetical protein IH969_08420, partial [Candidatus Krumholzibacteriota bacterium]|nr:hypothetical protein [Candidatus Krumholzibacteriota bacterium]